MMRALTCIDAVSREGLGSASVGDRIEAEHTVVVHRTTIF
ncbi:MAG: hypothetical protein ACJAXA_002757, partial [Candidatus Aldehydirespiratoraceae bacterium]